MKKLAIITVTHNSAKHLELYFASLQKQKIEFSQLILVDSGSADVDYLKVYQDIAGVQIIYAENIGFCRANNIGYAQLRPDIEAVLFLNPDVFFSANVLPQALQRLFADPQLFAVTPLLLRYAIDTAGEPILLEEIDSAGIEPTWYGRYYDRKEIDRGLGTQCFPAICGAFMLCRRSCLDEISDHGHVFREAMYMYKEDIEICLRAAHDRHYKAAVLPELHIYHGRGWQRRQDVAAWQKRRSSENERYFLPYCAWPKKIRYGIYYALKYIYVRYFET
jgi:Predicted glycosyltransferases